MEVNNRFELLTSLSIDEDPIQLSSININASEQQQQQEINDEQLTKNPWEIPEYVEKSIPCLFPININEKSSKSITKRKKSLHIKPVKPVVNISIDEEEQDDVESIPIVEVQSQPIIQSLYPPQPYKFKQTSINHRNETIPKFNRKMNVLPKHSSTRGNNNIGNILRQQNKFHQAIQYHEKLYGINNHLDMVRSCICIAKIFSEQNQLDKAFDFYEQALIIRKKLRSIESYIYIATLLFNIDHILYQQKIYDEALQYFQRSLNIRQTYYSSDYENIAKNLIYMNIIINNL